MLGFDRVRVDIERRIVEFDGASQHLEPQAFDVLAYLITNRERVVPKAELLDEVWGDQFVSESALTTRIKEVRKALGDDGTRQAVVRNYRARGYRFVPDLDDVDGDRPVAVQPGRSRVPQETLLGRSADVNEIEEMLESSAVVTLVGPGGVGKTALAEAVAGQVGSRMPGGQIVVTLAAVTDPLDVVHLLRRSSGLDDPNATEDDLLAALADRAALVVMDNCEHVIDEAARIVHALAVRQGMSRVLATSREPLAIPAEQVRPVQPLDAASARRLLIQRVRSLQPDWDGDGSAVDQLTWLVDRLPLAIEMAASCVPTIGVDDLVRLLEDRPELLRSHGRTVEDRHRTVGALIEWSLDLLAPSPRQLLCDLSVFAGPVTAVDIAAVMNLDAADFVTGPLQDLVTRSLVVADTTCRPARYHLLQTVKACVAGRRDPTVDERHAHFVARTLVAENERLRTPDESAAAARIDSLAAEIRSAHRWSRSNDVPLAATITTALLRFAFEHHWTEAAAWNQDLLDRCVDEEHAAAAAASLSADASNRGDYHEARRLAHLTLAHPSPLVQAFAHEILSDVGLYSGDFELSRRHNAHLFDIADRTGDPMTWALGRVSHALTALYAGDLAEAEVRLRVGRPPARLNPTSQAWLAYTEGEVNAARGHAEAALACFQRAMHLGQSVGSRFVVNVSRVSLMAAQARHGDIGSSSAELVEVLSEYRRTHQLTHGTTALRNLIGFLVRNGRDEEAMVLLGVVSRPDAKASYGSESDLVDEAKRIVDSRHQATEVEDWIERGAQHTVPWALDYVVDVLTEAERDAQSGTSC